MYLDIRYNRILKWNVSIRFDDHLFKCKKIKDTSIFPIQIIFYYTHNLHTVICYTVNSPIQWGIYVFYLCRRFTSIRWSLKTFLLFIVFLDGFVKMNKL